MTEHHKQHWVVPPYGNPHIKKLHLNLHQPTSLFLSIGSSLFPPFHSTNPLRSADCQSSINTSIRSSSSNSPTFHSETLHQILRYDSSSQSTRAFYTAIYSTTPLRSEDTLSSVNSSIGAPAISPTLILQLLRSAPTTNLLLLIYLSLLPTFYSTNPLRSAETLNFVKTSIRSFSSNTTIRSDNTSICLSTNKSRPPPIYSTNSLPPSEIRLCLQFSLSIKARPLH